MAINVTTISLGGYIYGPAGSLVQLAIADIVNAAANAGASQSETLSATPITIPVPTGAQFVIIQPPTANTVATVLSTNSNSQTTNLHPSNASLISFDSTLAQIKLSSASAQSGQVQVIWG
jgi:hypothetical protein